VTVARAFGAQVARLCSLTLLAGLVVCACAPSEPRETAIGADQSLARINRAARSAFELGRYEEAASLYRRALEIAYQRADGEAVVDAQYNVAVALLRLERIDEAMRRIEQAKAELERTGAEAPDELRLLEATVLFRSGRHREAETLVRDIVSRSPGTDAARRARFLGGLIAAEQGDALALGRAIEALGGASDPRLAADRAELNGLLALHEHRHEAALLAFAEAARLRRETRDYGGTARALAMAGEVHERAGDAAQAASHYLRAGRSLSHQGAVERARELLVRASELAARAGDGDTVRDARAQLKRLETDQPPSALP